MGSNDLRFGQVIECMHDIVGVLGTGGVTGTGWIRVYCRYNACDFFGIEVDAGWMHG